MAPLDRPNRKRLALTDETSVAWVDTRHGIQQQGNNFVTSPVVPVIRDGSRSGSSCCRLLHEEEEGQEGRQNWPSISISDETIPTRTGSKVFQRPRLLKKQVSFATCVETKEILHYADLTTEEIEAGWWSSHDYAMIKKAARISTQLLMQGHDFEENENDFCKRGLESRTSAGAEKRSRTKQRLIKAVLRAQYFQRLESIDDPAYIAEICAYHTESSVSEARALAEEDEKAVER